MSSFSMYKEDFGKGDSAAAGLQACRVCLVTGCKLFGLRTHRLAETFGELTGIQVSAADGLPQYVCSACGCLLLKYATFRDRCWTAHGMLQDACSQQSVTIEYFSNINKTSLILPLTTTKTQNIDIVPENVNQSTSIDKLEVEGEIKIEITSDKRNVSKILDEETTSENSQNILSIDTSQYYNNENFIWCKNESQSANFDDEDVLDCQFDLDTDDSQSDSKLKFNKKRKITKDTKKLSKKRKKGESKKGSKKMKVNNEIDTEKDVDHRTEEKNESTLQSPRKINSERKKTNKSYKYSTEEQLEELSKTYNVDIVILTEEEQRMEVEARKETANYKNSNFKCTVCYKGYLAEETFRNHMAVHHPSAGDHVCEICCFRFAKRKKYLAHLKHHKMNLICKECGNVSKTPCQAKEHFNWHKGYKLECEHCGKSFHKRSSHLSHVRIYHGSAPCALCGEAFIGDAGLRCHMQKAHKQALNSRCESCGVQFHSMEALNRHQLHSADDGCQSQNKPCAQCGEDFSTDESLKAHVDEHHKKEIKCDKCDKSFATDRVYKKHCFNAHRSAADRPAVRPVRKKKVCMCEMCGASFPSEAVLREHQRVHTGEKPYQCPECPKSFRIKLSLQDHLNIHTGERPYKCRHCPKAFRNQIARHRHQLVHTKERPHACPLCDKTYQSSTYVKIHVRTAHLKEAWPRRVRHRNKPHQPC